MNELRIGRVSSVNYPDGTAQVIFEDLGATTAEMSFLCPALQYAMPKVGDQVLVACLSNGSSAAVILGQVWHENHRPFEGREDFYSRELTSEINGKARESYDAKSEIYAEKITGKMQISASDEYTLTVGSAVVRVKKNGGVEIEAPAGMILNGNAKINGKLTVSDGVDFGAGNAGGAVVAGKLLVTGDVTVRQGVKVAADVLAGGVSLQNHTHTGVHGETSEAH